MLLDCMGMKCNFALSGQEKKRKWSKMKMTHFVLRGSIIQSTPLDMQHLVHLWHMMLELYA